MISPQLPLSSNLTQSGSMKRRHAVEAARNGSPNRASIVYVFPVRSSRTLRVPAPPPGSGRPAGAG